MDALIFEEGSNFSLVPENWGDAHPKDLIQVLKSCRDCFFENLDKNRLPQKTIVVRKSPYEYPVTYKQEYGDEILLSSKDTLWAQHSYQFAHELCHHVINTPSTYDESNARFGWFEESLCELVSLCVLYRMSIQWAVSPPYPSWRDYSNCLLEYASNIINAPQNSISKFEEWLDNKLDSLYSDRYERCLNRIIAVRLFPAFNGRPRMWILIQYLSEMSYDENTSFKVYLKNWNSLIPVALKPEMTNLCKSLGYKFV